MSKRFGQKRVPDCECTERFTCGKCLNAAGPTRSDGASVGYESDTVIDSRELARIDAQELRDLCDHD